MDHAGRAGVAAGAAVGGVGLEVDARPGAVGEPRRAGAGPAALGDNAIDIVVDCAFHDGIALLNFNLMAIVIGSNVRNFGHRVVFPGVRWLARIRALTTTVNAPGYPPTG